MMSALQHHRGATFAAIAGIVALIVIIVRLSQSRTTTFTETLVA
jgi:hypothetical protein